MFDNVGDPGVQDFARPGLARLIDTIGCWDTDDMSQVPRIQLRDLYGGPHEIIVGTLVRDDTERGHHSRLSKGTISWTAV